jgi:hypothetical protein
MTARMQKRLAIAGALALVALLLAYKGYMVTVAFSSQTACVVNEAVTGAPARRAC